MKDLYVFLLLIIWLLASVILAITAIGLFVVCDSGWMRFGHNLAEKLIK